MPANIPAATESAVNAEDHYALMTEVRDLKNTVAALRNKLEQEKASTDQAVQAAHAAAGSEIAQLKATAAALRDALEQARIDRDKNVQDAVVTANHEIVQLRATASALRDSLELERADVRWYLSTDAGDLPFPPEPGKRTTFRSITVDGQEVEFSEGFTDLHTRVYEQVLAGRGFGIDDARPSIDVTSAIRQAALRTHSDRQHPKVVERG